MGNLKPSLYTWRLKNLKRGKCKPLLVNQEISALILKASRVEESCTMTGLLEDEARRIKVLSCVQRGGLWGGSQYVVF